MHTPRRTRRTTALSVFTASLLFAPALFAASAPTGIFINGVELDQQQVALLYQSTGVSLLPGHYLVQGGCVSHLESGQTQCAPQPNEYGDGAYEYSGDVYGDGSDGYAYGGEAYEYGGETYGYGGEAYSQGGESYSYGGDAGGGGYGYTNGDGSWFHRGSDYSGGYSVGSDSNGCIYTPDWSNC